MKLETPVAFIIFNRPDLTQAVFQRIREAQPRLLLVVADGPRPGHPTDVQTVGETRAVIQQVDWPCEVLTNYAESNLGLRNRFSSGLKWVFNTVEEAIILEDDCVPEPTFFSFCQQVLARYRDDTRIAAISGNNYQDRQRSPHSYYFSKYFHCWGWASWRRFWRHFDVEMRTWPEFQSAGALRCLSEGPGEEDYWTKIFQRAFDNDIDAWSYAWQYACFRQNGLVVIPEVNLVSNIGFGERATHTKRIVERLANLPTGEMPQLDHPPYVVRQREADLHTYRRNFARTPAIKKWTRSLLKRLPGTRQLYMPRDYGQPESTQRRCA